MISVDCVRVPTVVSDLARSRVEGDSIVDKENKCICMATERQPDILAHLRMSMRSQIANDLQHQSQLIFAAPGEDGSLVNLLCGDSVSERLFHAFTGDGADDQIREATFQRNKEVEYSCLEWVICWKCEHEEPRPKPGTKSTTHRCRRIRDSSSLGR